MKTIRQMVDEKVATLRNADQLSPQQLAQEAIELSALWASVNKELLEREITYAHVLVALVEKHETVAKASLFGKTTEEYKLFREAEIYSKNVQDLIRVIKKKVALAEQEMRESKY